MKMATTSRKTQNPSRMRFSKIKMQYRNPKEEEETMDQETLNERKERYNLFKGKGERTSSPLHLPHYF